MKRAVAYVLFAALLFFLPTRAWAMMNGVHVSIGDVLLWLGAVLGTLLGSGLSLLMGFLVLLRRRPRHQYVTHGLANAFFGSIWVFGIIRDPSLLPLFLVPALLLGTVAFALLWQAYTLPSPPAGEPPAAPAPESL